MAEFDLNLSTRPFPAYRLINIALVAVLIVLAVLSVAQTVGFLRYSRLARSIRTAELDNRIQAEAMGKEVAKLESSLDNPESAAKLTEIGFLNHIILRRNLSWTRLFADLEEIVPDNVHFTSLTPDIAANGAVRLNLGVRARSIADVKEFLERVEKSPLFENVILASQQKNEASATTFPVPTSTNDVDLVLSAIYHPQGDTR